MGSKTSRIQKEDVLQLLADFDTVLIVDDSGSMSMEGRWEEAGKALGKLADAASRYDEDGIEIHFLNSELVARHVKDTRQVKAIFRAVEPRGMTPLGEKLWSLLDPYLGCLEAGHAMKPVSYIVITDGIPSDDPSTSPEVVLVRAARRLELADVPLTQVGVQFVQVGGDPGATEYLTVLDDSLENKHHIRDIVDTTPSKPGVKLDLIKILTGGINRRVDNKGSTSVTWGDIGVDLPTYIR